MIDNKKLAEGAGFTCPAGFWWSGHKWNKPLHCYEKLPPKFTESLDACLEHLVPGRVVEITFMYSSNCVSCDIEDLKGNFFEGHVDTKSIEEAWTKSALSFCLAFEKLMEAKK